MEVESRPLTLGVPELAGSPAGVPRANPSPAHVPACLTEGVSESTHPLTYQRDLRGLTRVDLADLIHAAARRRGLRSGVDKQRIRKWEVLGVMPDAANQTYIAEALDLPIELVEPDTWPHWLPLSDGGVVPFGSSSSVTALREALKTAMDPQRRAVLALSGSALTALAGSWAGGAQPATLVTHLSDGTLVGDDTVTMLEDSVRRLNVLATDQRQHFAALMDAHLTTVTNLIGHGRYDRTTGLRLHLLASTLAQTVAWHRFDHGRHTAAGQLWIAALHSAHATNDTDLGAAMLGDLAYQAAWRRDHATAASLLQHALVRTEHPAARSLLHLRLARTLAAQGEKRAALRALTAAEHHLGVSSGIPRPTWCAWMSEADLAVDSGQALLDLGDASRALHLITQGQALLPTSREKTKGVFLAYQAASHLRLREPELAAQAAGQALQLARRIDAPRCERLVQDLLPSFTPYEATPGVPELQEAAARRPTE